MQVAEPPVTLKVPPVEAKPVVAFTVRVPPARLWLAPLTVVVSAGALTIVVAVTAALSSGVPVQPLIPVKEVAVVPV